MTKAVEESLVQIKRRRDFAYADCRIRIGDMVLLDGMYGQKPKRVVAVYWSEAGVEWRVGVAGYDAPQSRFHLTPSAS